MANKDGGAAFPGVFTDQYGVVRMDSGGMSLRDHFAAKALQGWITSGAIARIIAEEQCSMSSAHIVLAAGCYALADAMLAERAK